MTIIAILLINH